MNVTYNIDPLIRAKQVSEFLTLPIIIRVKDFTVEAVEKFSDSMSQAHGTGQKIIPVVVDSYGGECFGLQSMISIIKTSKIKVATIVEGKAMSCGAYLFSYGAQGYRFMAPDAVVMIHEASGWTFGKTSEIKSFSDFLTKYETQANEALAANCGKDPSYFTKLIHDNNHADLWMDAKECLKHGLANHIRVPDLRVSAQIGYELV